MKGLRVTLASLFLVGIAGARTPAAFAESIPYEFATVDIRVPDSSVRWTPDDINRDGVLLTNVRIDNLAEAVIASPLNRDFTKFKTNAFSCTGLAFADTSAWSIDDKGQIVGYCSDAPSGPSRLSGFVRRPKGDHILLDFPGADHTLAFGISDHNQVVGHYYNPLIPGQPGLSRIHGFLWDGEKYSTIDFPRLNTYTMLWSINKSGQILGECYTFDPATNETLAHNWFVYDNGNFIMDFPESLEHIGGPAIHLADMNDSGQIVGLRSNAGPEWNGAFLYQGGTFYDIEFPSGWLVTDVRGISNKGQFVGTYAVQVGIDPFYGSPIYEHHGYSATPGTQRKTGKPVLSRAISMSLSESNSIGPTEQTHDLIHGRRYSFAKQFESLRSLAAK